VLPYLLHFAAQGELDSDPTWNLVAGGDIMFNSVPAGRRVFQNLKIAKRDIFYANLEIPLTNTRERTPRKTAAEIARRDQYVLKADPRHISNLVEAGLDVVSLGNNHIMDGGASGMRQNNKLLDKVGIRYCGAAENLEAAEAPALVIAPDGTRVAFISYLSFRNQGSIEKCGPATSTSPGLAGLTLGGRNGMKELERLQEIVSKAKQQADLLFVCLHWGIEKQPLPADYQVSLGRLFIDAGADGVLGNHPHVLQPAEMYNGKPIVYSMGNFVHPGSGNTALYSLKFKGKELVSGKVIPLRYSGGVLFPRQVAMQSFIQEERKFETKFGGKGLLSTFAGTVPQSGRNTAIIQTRPPR
jgi:poly-gamma-glutamate synthesis protein (capsule biosynthesis protein)